MSNNSDPTNNDLTVLAQSVGYRNRAGAPLGAQNPSYDAHLAYRLLTAAHEVMQRVVDDPPRHGMTPNMIPAMAPNAGRARATTSAVATRTPKTPA